MVNSGWQARPRERPRVERDARRSAHARHVRPARRREWSADAIAVDWCVSAEDDARERAATERGSLPNDVLERDGESIATALRLPRPAIR
jgi:hypothetical protein